MSLIADAGEIVNKNSNILLVVRKDLIGVSRLPQVLHNAHCKVTLFAPAGIAITRSRFVDTHIVAKLAEDPFIQQLQNFLNQRGTEYQWIIIGDESILNAISTQYRGEWLSNWFPVSWNSQAIDLINSKFNFLLAASDAGLPVPPLQICHSFSATRQMAESFGNPVVLKLPVGAAGSGVRIVQSQMELLPTYMEFAAGQPVAVQKFVHGAVGLTEVLFDQGNPICWASSYKIQCWPNAFSASCVREVMDHDEIKPLINGIGALTGFHGLGGVDWVQDPVSGSLSLIEFNARPTPGYHLRKVTGVNFSQAINSMLSGHPEVQFSRQESLGAKVFMFPQSFYWAISERTPWPLIYGLRDAPWNDPLLLIALLRRLVSHYLPIGIREKLKPYLRLGSGKS